MTRGLRAALRRMRLHAAPRRPLRAWLRAMAMTMGLLLLVAWGVGDEGHMLPFAVLGVAGLGLGLLYRLFPRGVHFAFGTATGLALYATIFVVMGRAQFPDAPEWAPPPAFLLPVLTFLAAVWRRRHELTAIAELQAAENLDHLPHATRWVLLVSGVGLVCFVLPLNRQLPLVQGLALLGSMALIGAMVAYAVRDVVRLLVDVALIVDELAGRIRHLAVPMVAFLLMYGLLLIGFASAYRIADALSTVPLFAGPHGAIRLSYSDALHFSLATQSTVGYGDIQPVDDGIRVLSTLQVVGGQLLLLFGFAEIMRSRRARADGRPDALEAPSGALAAAPQAAQAAPPPPIPAAPPAGDPPTATSAAAVPAPPAHLDPGQPGGHSPAPHPGRGGAGGAGTGRRHGAAGR